MLNFWMEFLENGILLANATSLNQTTKKNIFYWHDIDITTTELDYDKVERVEIGTLLLNLKK